MSILLLNYTENMAAFTSSNQNESCFEFTAEEVNNVIIGKVIVSVVSSLACLLAITFIITFKEYHKFVQRLMLYLMITGFAYGVAIALEEVPVRHKDDDVVVKKGQKGLCAAFGYISKTTSWIFYMVIFWITIYLFLLAVFKYSIKKRKHEICGIIISLALPLTLTWIPFIHNKYGLAGLWCWIKLTSEDCHHKKLGFIYQSTLDYGPEALLLLFTSVSYVLIIIVLCKHRMSSTGGVQSSIYRQALKEALPLLAYPIIYGAIYILMVANPIYYALSSSKNKPSYPLWQLHALAIPMRVLLPALAFLLHPNTLKTVFCKRSSRSAHHTDTTAFIVSAEYPFSEVDPLIIRGREENSPRYTSVFEETLSDN